MTRCAVCGEPVPSRSSSYCGDRCRARAKRRRQRARRRADELEANALVWDALDGAPVAADPGYARRIAQKCRDEAAELRAAVAAGGMPPSSEPPEPLPDDVIELMREIDSTLRGFDG